MQLTDIEFKQIVDFLNTSYGQMTVRLGLVLIMAEAFRIFLKKFFEVVEVYTTARKKAVDALTDFIAYVGNVSMSIMLGVLYSSNYKSIRELTISFIYGMASILIHWSIVSGRLKQVIGFILRIKKKNARG